MRLNQDSVFNKPTKIYLFSYKYDNATWRIEIPAYDETDAKKRVKELINAKYDGELQLTIDIPSNN